MAKAALKSYKFKEGDVVATKSHGVGQIIAVGPQDYAGYTIEGVKILARQGTTEFTHFVPMAKIDHVGLRALSSKKTMKEVVDVLKGTPKRMRGMWPKRAAKYEEKINSGNPLSVAEVVRDLFRHETDGEQSYSEKQIYRVAIDKLAREFAAVEGLSEDDAVDRLEQVMRKAT